VGRADSTRIAPAEALRNGPLPCGPRTICTLRTSKSPSVWIAGAEESIVWEIDLKGVLQPFEHDIPGKRPRYLYLDDDGKCFAAPQVSGNNTTHTTMFPQETVVEDLSDEADDGLATAAAIFFVYGGYQFCRREYVAAA